MLAKAENQLCLWHWPVSGSKRSLDFNARLGVAIWDMDDMHRVESLTDAASATLLDIGVSYGRQAGAGSRSDGVCTHPSQA